MAERTNYQVRALERALDILDVFSLAEPELSLSEIALRVDLARSTTFRMLSILEERGYVERGRDDHYRIGIRAFEIGSIYIQATTIEAEAQPFLQRLSRTCQQTANLAVLNRGEIVHIAVVPPDRPIRFYATVGQREAAYCSGLGKALISELGDEQIAGLFAERGMPRKTATTLTTLDALRAQLATIREVGFAFDNEEATIGLKCVAAPVRDARNQIIAAVSVSGPAFEFGEEVLPSYISAVTCAAHDISARLGNTLWSTRGDEQEDIEVATAAAAAGNED